MAHQETTGKDVAVTYDGASIPTGWQKITIAEKGKPLREQIDKTHAGDAAYAFMDDPLGGKGSASCTVTIEGLLSVTDHQDSGLLTKSIDGEATLVVSYGSGKDKFTLTDAGFKSHDAGGPFANVQPFRSSFSNPASAGAWSTAA
jgi:hypothetical protein